MAAANTDSRGSGDQIKAILRRCRGRPRLTDADRAQRRLESRKKYDVRRVYLGEAHQFWSELRRRTSLSDAGLAEYLIMLNSAYGDKYQEKYGKSKNLPEQCNSHRKGKKVSATSLQNLMSWYQGHCQSCPHEPELRAVEPTVGLSTSALWQCVSGHSFVQYLPWPAGADSESEVEDDNNEKDDGVPEKKSALCENIKRRKTLQNQKELQDAVDELESDAEQSSPMAHQMTCTSLSDLPGAPAAHRSPSSERSLGNHAVWAMEVLMDQQAQAAIAESDGKASTRVASRDANPVLKQADGSRPLEKAESYECVVVTTPLTDKREREDVADHSQEGVREAIMHSIDQDMTHTPLAAAETQSELYETQDLQKVMDGCELPDQRSTLEGSQLIIITGPSYEALTSESIQLNVGGGDVEEVTCTVIGDMTYNHMCQSGVTSGPNTVTDMGDKQLFESSEETHCPKELQRSLNRTKKSRRGPVIEADGMLKMFHCPYEGCSQVYVAISSFQNHVNLVHRKGRTKVCPHPGCGKKFYLSNHLHRHMIIHSGVRDFICETCGKSFKRKNHLEVHRRTHTGETPLQCEICGYQCRQRASLNWHMRKHTSEAHFNYTCEHCGKRFEKLDSVKFHKLKSHPDKQAPEERMIDS
ncbi:zinc finger protein 653 [Xyrauchen texanus]|uniref:zinc finger protein 653 n=1 Tax=Xyrauchen texanus TaxID=154827 RepID=UPI002242A167|nr:zinc finger protein 653 [Xyrauchen texanus]